MKPLKTALPPATPKMALDEAEALFFKIAQMGLIGDKALRKRIRQWLETRPREVKKKAVASAKNSRWVCPSCSSRNVQVSYPTWYYEALEGEPTLVEPDFMANVLWWSCGACGETGEDDPDQIEDYICRTEGCENSLSDGEGYDGYCGSCADRQFEEEELGEETEVED
jgi:hypothetical protein